MIELSVCIEVIFEDEPFVDRIERTAAAGADAFEFWGWRDRDLDAIERAREEAGLDLAAVSGNDEALTNPSATEAAADIEQSIEVARDIGCPTLTLTAGPEQDDVPRAEQRDAIVETLRNVAGTAERAGVMLVLEPWNPVENEDYSLHTSEEAYEIVRAVDSSNVKVLFDVAHQQVTEGNIIENVTEHVDLIGHFHVADVPGRHEPGTGELNYENVLEAIAETDYDGYVGCEFSPQDDPMAAIENVGRLLRS